MKSVHKDLIDILHHDTYFDLNHYKHKKLFADCTYVWEALTQIDDYLKQQTLGNIEAAIPEGVFLENPHLISISRGTVIEPGAFIRGPCIIGENCSVRHGAYIRGNLIAGNNCVIGHDTEIKNVIMLDHAVAAHFAYLGDSILGNNVNLGAGTKCANLKLDGSEIIVKTQEKKVPTGLRKFGAIIGDGARTGCNSVTNPGTFLGKNSCFHPCVNFGGIIPANHQVKSEQKVTIQPNSH